MPSKSNIAEQGGGHNPEALSRQGDVATELVNRFPHAETRSPTAGTFTLASVLDEIKTGECADPRNCTWKLAPPGSNAACQHQATIDWLRGMPKAEYDDAKKSLPAFTPAGTFSRRANARILQHSGLVVVDLDHLSLHTEPAPLKERLSAHPAIKAIFLSPSGDGLKLLMRCTIPTATSLVALPKIHRQLWFVACNSLPDDVRAWTDKEGKSCVDKSGKDVARLCFLSSDLNAYIAPADKAIVPLSLPEAGDMPRGPEEHPPQDEANPSAEPTQNDDRKDAGTWKEAVKAQQGITLRKRGRQLEGRCPNCGGSKTADRFWVNLDPPYLFGCRQCDKPQAILKAAFPPIAPSRLQLEVGRNLTDDAEAAGAEIIRQNDPAYLFQVNTDAIVYFPGDRMKVLEIPQIAVQASRFIDFGRMDKENHLNTHYPNEQLVRATYDYLKRFLPPLNGVKYSPFIWNGELVEGNTYHEESGFYRVIPEGISRDLTIEESLEVIEDYFGEFPYETLADKWNTWAKILSSPLKTYGNEPIFACDKPDSQTGASKLVTSIIAVADGFTPTSFTPTAGEYAMAENEKRLMSALMDQPTSLLLDNIEGKFVSGTLASGLTLDKLGGRILGKNKQFHVNTAALSVYMTGNNLQVQRDLINRSIHVRLNARTSRPELRTNFRHNLHHELLIPEVRVKVLSAVCSIVQAWLNAGAPTDKTGNHGSFWPFQSRVSGLLTWLGMEYNKNANTALRNSDNDSVEMGDFIWAWWDKFQDSRKSAGDLLNLAKIYLTITGKDDAAEAAQLGRKIGKSLGKTWDAAERDPEETGLVPGQQIELLKHPVNVHRDPHRRVWQLALRAAEMPFSPIGEAGENGG